MTGRDLLLDAIRGRVTPRPAWVPFVGVHGGNLIGRSAGDYLQSADLIRAGLNRARELYQPDGLPVVFDLQLEAEVLGCDLAWAEETPPAVASHPLSHSEGPGMAISDLPAFSTRAGRFPIALDAARRLKKDFNNEVALYGLITGPFTLALHLLGSEIFLQMCDAPDKVLELVDYATGVAYAAADAWVDAGVDVVAVVDPMVSQISPRHFESLVAPGLTRLFDHIRRRRAVSSMFVCGDATRNLEAMCRLSCDNVSIDENVDLNVLAKMAPRHGKSFGGNLRLTTALLMGTPDDVRRDVLRCLDAGGNRGFVLAPGCDLPYAVPETNVRAVAELVHDALARETARGSLVDQTPDDFADIVIPDYEAEQAVYVDVITLDSAACAPCQYMMNGVTRAAALVDHPVVIREHKINTRDGVGHLVRLGVRKVPSICIEGQVRFESLIPDTNVLADAIRAGATGKATGVS